MRNLDSEWDKSRYVPQINVKEIGEEGQKKLLSSKVLIIGSGALGSMAAMQLAGAGVGIIGIVDFDTVEISNLHRQLFFETESAGHYKVDELELKIKRLNPDIEVIKFKTLLSLKNSGEFIPQFDFVIDATDNYSSKKLICDCCMKERKPCCVAGVSGFRGQVMTVTDKSSASFHDLFHEEEGGGIMPCSMEGIIGPCAVFAATLQATEAMKFILGIGETLSGRIFVFDLLNNSFKLFSID